MTNSTTFPQLQMTNSTTSPQLQSIDFDNKAWITFSAYILDTSGNMMASDDVYLNQSWTPNLESSGLQPGTIYNFHLYAHGAGNQTWDYLFEYQPGKGNVRFRADGILGFWKVTQE